MSSKTITEQRNFHKEVPVVPLNSIFHNMKDK